MRVHPVRRGCWRASFVGLLVVACGAAEGTEPDEQLAGSDAPVRFVGTASALYFSMDVPPLEEVEATVTVERDGPQVRLPFVLCEVVGTATALPGTDRVLVEVDAEATACGFDAGEVAVDVVSEASVVSWDSEGLSIWVTGEGSAPGVAPFEVTLSFDGVVAR